MSLNIAAQAQRNSGEAPVQRDIAKKGPRVAIITGIIDLGMQPQEYEGEKKPDCREFLPILTLVNDKYSDDSGVEHHMRVSPWPLKIKLGDRANYPKFCNAADPAGEIVPDGVGDLSGLIGKAVFATIVHNNGKGDYKDIVYANCKGISELPEDYPVADIEYEGLVFDSTNPDKEVFDKLYERTQDLITSAAGWVGFGDAKVEPASADVGDGDNLDDIPF